MSYAIRCYGIQGRRPVSHWVIQGWSGRINQVSCRTGRRHNLGSWGRTEHKGQPTSRATPPSPPTPISFLAKSTSTCTTHPAPALSWPTTSPGMLFSSTPPSNPPSRHTWACSKSTILKHPTRSESFPVSLPVRPSPAPQQFLSLPEIHNPLFSPLSTIMSDLFTAGRLRIFAILASSNNSVPLDQRWSSCSICFCNTLDFSHLQPNQTSGLLFMFCLPQERKWEPREQKSLPFLSDVVYLECLANNWCLNIMCWINKQDDKVSWGPGIGKACGSREKLG